MKLSDVPVLWSWSSVWSIMELAKGKADFCSAQSENNKPQLWVKRSTVVGPNWSSPHASNSLPFFNFNASRNYAKTMQVDIRSQGPEPMQQNSSHDFGGDSGRGSGGYLHHQEKNWGSHQKKPQREPSYQCHVDPCTIGRWGCPSSSQSRVGYCSIGWGQSSDQVLTVWNVEMGKLLQVFLLLASGGACLFGHFEHNSLSECRISIVWMLKCLWAIWLPHRGLDNY